MMPVTFVKGFSLTQVLSLVVMMIDHNVSGIPAFAVI